MNVPFVDLKIQYQAIKEEIDREIQNVIDSTSFIMGPQVQGFERAFADLHGARHCIGTSSGTDALHLILWALGIGKGDGVLIPVNTFMATAEAVCLCGAVPIFVDCDEYFNLDVQGLETAYSSFNITPAIKHIKCHAGLDPASSPILDSRFRGNDGFDMYCCRSNNINLVKAKSDQKAPSDEGQVRAIIPVHLYGQPADMNSVIAFASQRGIAVVEDACQAHLSSCRLSDGLWRFVGSMGIAGAFSFFPGKNLGAYGEAGAVISNDDSLYQKIDLLHNHGSKILYYHDVVGHNYRMEAIQGAVLNVKLKYLEQWTKARQSHAILYEELLKDIEEVVTPKIEPGRTHSFHLYVIRCRNRDRLQNYLKEKGIDTGLHYPVPLHLQKAFAYLGYRKGDFPLAEKYAEEILSLPMFPELTDRQIRYVAEHIKGFYAQRV